jgi:hypothetical protein
MRKFSVRISDSYQKSLILVFVICPHANSGAMLWTVLQPPKNVYFAILLLAQSELVTVRLEIILCKNRTFYLTWILYLVSGARCSALLLIYFLYYQAIEFRIDCLVRSKSLNIRHICFVCYCMWVWSFVSPLKKTQQCKYLGAVLLRRVCGL